VDREEVVDNRLRRYYRITPKGSETLAGEAARLQANAAVAQSRLAQSRLARCPIAPPRPNLAGGAS
jgi:DNA-binding PadR family transcriptional regulator